MVGLGEATSLLSAPDSRVEGKHGHTLGNETGVSGVLKASLLGEAQEGEEPGGRGGRKPCSACPAREPSTGVPLTY